MIYSKPTENPIVPYSTVKIGGCSETKLGFDFLSEQPLVSKRRYCNKVLVHECVAVPEISPLELERVEFLATDDACYTYFNMYKSSDTIEDIDPTIELQLNDDDLVIGVIVTFKIDEICCQPLRMTYRLYGYTPEPVDVDDPPQTRILLSNGNLYINNCTCPENVTPTTWTDIRW